MSLVVIECVFVTSGNLCLKLFLHEGHSVRVVFLGFHTSVYSSGLFGLDSHDLSIDVFLDLFGLFFTEHVDGTWDNLGNASKDVGLDDLLVFRDLIPFLLALNCCLNVVLSCDDLCISRQNDILDSGKLNDVVTGDRENGECFGGVIESCVKAEELEILTRYESLFSRERGGNVDDAA